METVDYLRIARRRKWVLILVPLLAVAAAAVPIVKAPPSYSATATLSTTSLVTGPTSQFAGPQAVSTFVAAFTSAATGPAVLSAVSKKTHVPVRALSDNLQVSQRGASSDMALTFTSTQKSAVARVLRAVEAQTLKSLFSSQVALAKKQLDNARAAVESANQAMTALGQKYGTADPIVAYQAQLYRVNALLQHQINLRAGGNDSAALAMQPSIDSAQNKLAQFGPILAQYNNLSAAQQASVTDLGSAQQNFRAARAQLSAADPARITFVSATRSVSKVSALVHTLVPVFGAGVIGAVILVLMLELLASARRSSRESEHDVEAGLPAAGRPYAGSSHQDLEGAEPRSTRTGYRADAMSSVK